MFMTVVIKCHSVNYDTFNAKLTLFKMHQHNVQQITKSIKYVQECSLPGKTVGQNENDLKSESFAYIFG